MYLKPDNFSDPRKIAFAAGHAILFNIICPFTTKHITSTSLNNCKVINNYKIIFQYPLCMYTLFDEKVEVKKYSHQNSIAICESYMVISTGKRANFEDIVDYFYVQ
jgi:hypothetical protein